MYKLKENFISNLHTTLDAKARDCELSPYNGVPKNKGANFKNPRLEWSTTTTF